MDKSLNLNNELESTEFLKVREIFIIAASDSLVRFKVSVDDTIVVEILQG